jgi:hypothetical protein
MKVIKVIFITAAIIIVLLYLVSVLFLPFSHKEFNYNGHSYIELNSTVLHNPDCRKCDSIQNAKFDKLVNSLKIGDE